MIKEAKLTISEKYEDEETLNDLCSGLLNTNFCVGSILGTLIGNWGFMKVGAEATCSFVGIFIILFGIYYYFICYD